MERQMISGERTTRWPIIVAVLAIWLGPKACPAVPKVGDITHLQGSRTNKLMGIGLVVALVLGMVVILLSRRQRSR